MLWFSFILSLILLLLIEAKLIVTYHLTITQTRGLNLSFFTQMHFSFIPLTKPKETDFYTKDKNLAQHIPFYNQCIICQENVYNGAYHPSALLFTLLCCWFSSMPVQMILSKGERISIFFTEIVAESVSNDIWITKHSK